MKICIIVQSLANGGAERSSANLSFVLSDLGYEVHIVSLVNEIEYPYKGTLFNLGKYKSKGEFKFFQRAKRFFILKKFFKKEQFDYVIDNRVRKYSIIELLYLFITYRYTKVIYVVRSFNVENYLPKSNSISRLMISKCYSIVGVSRQIAQKINSTYGIDKAIYIYNSIQNLSDFNINSNTGDFILFLGRLSESSKNIDLLIEAYSLVEKGLRQKLIIQGDGPDKDLIRSKIKQLNLYDDIELRSFDSNIETIIKKARYLILTSRYEGFPRVLIEALSYGTPVVSVDCNSGPAEIITHEHNGLLVENHNPRALAKAMERMVRDEELYQRCKINAVASISHLKPEIIGKEWMKLLS